MTKRIIIAFFGIPILLFAVLSHWLYNLPFLIFLVLLNGFALNELHHIFSLKNIKINKTYLIFSGIIMILALYLQSSKDIWNAIGMSAYRAASLPLSLFNMIFILSIGIYFISIIFEKDHKDTILKISCFTFGLFYITYLSGYFLILKTMPEGSYYLFLIILLIWLNDSFAYFGGILFGKKKLPIKASPNKTYAGLYCGIIFSIISIFVSEGIFKEYISLSLFQKIFTGFIFGIIVILSDLLESILKRSVGIKDSKGIFPGHGGILDIFDGWFLTIPLFYFYLKFILA